MSPKLIGYSVTRKPIKTLAALFRQQCGNFRRLHLFLFCFFDRVPPILTASTFAERLNYLLACQSISYSHPHQKYSGGKTLLVEMPGFEPGSCQYFLIRFTLFYLCHQRILERVPRIELGCNPWQGFRLPLHHTRIIFYLSLKTTTNYFVRSMILRFTVEYKPEFTFRTRGTISCLILFL